MNAQYGFIEKVIFFVQVVRDGSISVATKHFSISIATGSRWITDLESDYDLKLLNRKGCSIQISNSGRIFYDKWKHISDEIVKINRQIKNNLNEQKGNVKICCTPVYASFLLPAIAKYSLKNPKVKFNIEVNPHGLVNSNRYDIIFSAISSYDHHLEKNIAKIRKTLMNQPFITVASQDYIDRKGKIETPLDLINHDCLYARSLTPNNEWAYKISNEKVKIKTDYILEVSDSNLLLQAVILGTGIGYLPEEVVKHSITTHQVIRILEQYEDSDWQLNMYYECATEIDAVVKNFKNFFIQQMT